MLFKRFFSAVPFEKEVLLKKMKYSDIVIFNDFLQEYDWDIFAWISGQRNAPEKYERSNMFKILKENIFPKLPLHK